MRMWLIRQDRPNGGILSFAGEHAFQARWSFSADPPSGDLPQDLSRQDSTRANDIGTDNASYWFRTGEDDDDIVIRFEQLCWQDAPPRPKRVRRLIKNAVNEINQQVGERF